MPSIQRLRRSASCGEKLSVNANIVVRHSFGGEPALECGPHLDAIQVSDSPNRRYGFFDRVDDET